MQTLILPKISKPLTYIPQINLSASKSIANRALLLAMLTPGISTLHNLPYRSDDIKVMLDIMKQLQVTYKLYNMSDYACSIDVISMLNSSVNNDSDISVDCDNSGTAYRFIVSALVLHNISATVTGSPRMQVRPIEDLVSALNLSGANIKYLGSTGFPPIRINQSQNVISNINIKADVSSQYLSSLLLVSWVHGMEINLQGDMISEPYVNMTIELLRSFGVIIYITGNQYKVDKQSLSNFTYTIEADMSSASYFIALSSQLGVMQINNLPTERTLQGDAKFTSIITDIGGCFNSLYNSFEYGYLLQNKSYDMLDMPDAAMTLLVVGALSQGQMTLSNIRSWRVKETNRIVAMASNLCELGFIVDYSENEISVVGGSQINHNIIINTYNDHRIAMCFAIFATQVSILIENPKCTNKTFANYWQEFLKLYRF